MRFSMRALAIAAVSAVACLAMGSAASAVTVSPAGGYTFTASGSTALRLTSIGTTLTCTSNTATGSVNADGTGSFPAGGIVYSGCTNILLGPFSVNQTAVAPTAITALLDGSGRVTGIKLRVSIPTGGITLANNAGTCSFTVSGSVDFLLALTTPTAPPVNVTTALRIPASASAIVVDSITGTGQPCPSLVRGLAATYAGTYVISRTATIGL